MYPHTFSNVSILRAVLLNSLCIYFMKTTHYPSLNYSANESIMLSCE